LIKEIWAARKKYEKTAGYNPGHDGRITLKTDFGICDPGDAGVTVSAVL
jgi:hypothetical protein